MVNCGVPLITWIDFTVPETVDELPPASLLATVTLSPSKLLACEIAELDSKLVKLFDKFVDA